MNFLERIVSGVARVVPRGGGRVVGGLDRWYASSPPRSVRIGDLPVTLDPRIPIERLMMFRAYEPRLLRFAASLLRPGDTAVDVGAHVGWHALHYLRRVTRRGIVHAFEPVPRHHARLEEAFAAARGRGYRCAAHRLALSDRAGTTTMSVGAESNPGFNTLLHDFSRDGLRSGYAEVEARTLDGVLEEAGIAEVALLKIDVEGAEGMVLRGARRLLESGRARHLLVEISPRAEEVTGRERGDTVRLLESHGYVGHLMERGRPRPLPRRHDYWVADTYWRRG